MYEKNAESKTDIFIYCHTRKHVVCKVFECRHFTIFVIALVNYIKTPSANEFVRLLRLIIRLVASLRTLMLMWSSLPAHVVARWRTSSSDIQL